MSEPTQVERDLEMYASTGAAPPHLLVAAAVEQLRRCREKRTEGGWPPAPFTEGWNNLRETPPPATAQPEEEPCP